ncbi:MAG: HlyD family secretion protein, partial [Saprospiraceae bacterium]
MDRKIEKKTWTKGRIAAIVLMVAAASFLISAVYRNNGNTKLNVQSERLLTDKVKTGTFQEFIPVTGIVQPIKTVLIGAVEGGKVEEKYIEDGEIVKKGQMILKLSNPDLMSNFLNQEANIVSQINQIRNTALLMDQQSLNLKEQSLQVDYQIDLTKARLNRNRELAKTNVISKVELEEMEAEYNNLLQRRKLFNSTIEKDEAYQKLQQDQMDSSLDLMERNLAITRQNLDNLKVKAPIDGQLSGLDLEIGELVTRGSSIGQIDDLSNFKITVRIDEFYISRVFVEQ